jgi:hypothetical protein
MAERRKTAEDRDAREAAADRAWAAEIRRKAEAGELEDDTDKVREMLHQEIAKLVVVLDALERFAQDNPATTTLPCESTWRRGLYCFR